MAVAPPSYCFVAFPPRAKDGLVVFGKNSARPRDEVQEVVYFPAADHEPESKVECTYISIDQVLRTHAIVISRPAWLWGAEMGANEHGVCIANEAINAREPAAESEIFHKEPWGHKQISTWLLNERLGLERGAAAKEALDVIVSLLEEHGQGGNYYEDANSCHSFQSAYLLVDREEAWVLETIGKYWAAEKITEGVKCICNQLSLTTRIDAEHPELRNYAQSQGWWTGEDEFNFSEVFSLADEHLDCCAGKNSLEKQEAISENLSELQRLAGTLVIHMVTLIGFSLLVLTFESHFLVGSRYLLNLHRCEEELELEREERSIFKPFIFVDDVKLVPKAQSPSFGDEDPAKKEPRFQEKPDRRHELYKAHEWARAVIASDQEQGHKLQKTMLELEKQGLEAMEEILSSSAPLDPTEVGDIFYDCVDTEIKFFK
ncbi:secernin-1 [Orycteropus afer afer]|uniref:Secernin-1 n=1 Tax=Orycteropus afer afer TaxID=1230840 RepID=A0A8B7AB12_ORYAF|nr:secernin-1 [Orycteropus afer afer]